MPRTAVTDAEHVVYTDHSIPRRPVPRNARPPSDAPLVAFGVAIASPRDLGLAYATVAVREDNAAYRERAFDLLRQANQTMPDDPQTLSYLADLYKRRSEDREAARLYEELLRVDPSQSSAPAALGAYAMEQGHYEEAIRLWNIALRISPALVLVRLNLAVALDRTGRRSEARAQVEKTLELNPWLPAARRLLEQLSR